MVNLIIDGKPVQVPEGTTVLQAAETAGIHIPTLCHHPALTPFGGCRLCLVEVEGARTLQPSCTLPASEKMNVLTNTAKVKAARKFVLTLIFSDRNHFCPFCQVTGGDCELQNAALNESMDHWPFQPNWQHLPVDATQAYYVMDHNRCILCHRCVRACGQLVGNFTLGIEERGASSMLVADTGVPLGESTCVSCGTCVAVCPTGALIERRFAYQGLEKLLDSVQSICIGCSLGCGITAFSRDNRLVRVVGDWDAPVNGGVLCKLGRFTPMEEDRERITQPMLKKDGQLQPATWEEAVSAVASRFQPLAGKNGSGVAALISPRLPVEAISAFKQVFVSSLNSNMVASLDEDPAISAAVSLAKSMGRPFEAGLEALEVSDCVVAAGVNLAEDHMVAGFLVKRNLPGGTRLIVIDSGENGWDNHADLRLKPARGSEASAARGVQAGLIKLGLKEGAYLSAVAELTEMAQATGLSEDDLLRAAGMIGTSKSPVVVYGAAMANALPQLVELTALAGAALVGIKAEANSMAAAQYNMNKPFALNGHQAVYIALGDDQPSQRLVQQLEKAPFLAVQASYKSRLTAMADVVLPVEMWAEQEGHFVNTDGRVQEARKILAAPQGVLSNEEALKSLAALLNTTINPEWEISLCEQPAPVALKI
jgi:formate dehydrogenase major subunit